MKLVTNDPIISWLLQGDVAIQYQTKRDLLGVEDLSLQNRIAYEGWGNQFLAQRKENGHWGSQFYQPKWISTHYTLLDLRNLCLNSENRIVQQTLDLIIKAGKAEDGGIPLGPSTRAHSDVCVNGMFLNYASYFGVDEVDLLSVVDSILDQIMPDGGFNCRSNRSGAKHSSLHSTISVLEGFREFEKRGYTHRTNEIQNACQLAEEFILVHQLFLSDRTGKIIHNDFLKLRYPCRWKYDILRALDYFQYSKTKWDTRMEAAIDVLHKKRRKDNRWNVQAAHAGQVHFTMEKAGQASRWNTLRALRALSFYKRLESHL